MSDERAFDLATPFQEAHAFIQWKGTDVCMDFRCDCGLNAHVDGLFVYRVKCSSCGAVWEMPSNLFPRKIVDDGERAYLARPGED